MSDLVSLRPNRATDVAVFCNLKIYMYDLVGQRPNRCIIWVLSSFKSKNYHSTVCAEYFFIASIYAMIVNSKLLTRCSKVKRRAPDYSQALNIFTCYTARFTLSSWTVSVKIERNRRFFVLILLLALLLTRCECTTGTGDAGLVANAATDCTLRFLIAEALTQCWLLLAADIISPVEGSALGPLSSAFFLGLKEICSTTHETPTHPIKNEFTLLGFTAQQQPPKTLWMRLSCKLKRDDF